MQFDDWKEGEQNAFKINEDFAKKYEHNKRRELLDIAKWKYGEAALLDDARESEESESSSSDDSEAELINERVENKFLQVMDAIRSKDKDKIASLSKAPDANIFEDEDFSETKNETKKDKKFTLKDQIREHALRKMSNSSQSESDSSDSDGEAVAKRATKGDLFTKKGEGVPLFEQQMKIKDEFKRQANLAESSDSEDLLVKKKVQRDQDSDGEPAPRKQVKKEKKEATLVTDKELLARFYGNDQELNPGEKFLRNYILNEGWKDAGAMKLTKDKEALKLVKSDASGASVLYNKDVAPLGDGKVDDEDLQRENEMDVFE